LGLKVFFLLKDKKYTEALALLKDREEYFSVFLRVNIHMQQRQPVLAMDALLSNLSQWKPSEIPEGYIQMLIKSSLNL